MKHPKPGTICIIEINDRCGGDSYVAKRCPTMYIILGIVRKSDDDTDLSIGSRLLPHDFALFKAIKPCSKITEALYRRKK